MSSRRQYCRESMALIKTLSKHLELIFFILLLFHGSHIFFLSRQEYWGPEGKSYVLKSSYMSVKGRNNCWWKGSLYFNIRCFDLSTSSSGLFSPPLFRNVLLISSIDVFQTTIYRYILVSTWFITLNRNSLSLELIPCKFRYPLYPLSNFKLQN